MRNVSAILMYRIKEEGRGGWSRRSRKMRVTVFAIKIKEGNPFKGTEEVVVVVVVVFTRENGGGSAQHATRRGGSG